MKARLLSLSFRWVACLACVCLAAQSRVPGAPTLEQLTPEQGKAFLEGFRRSRLEHDLCLRFEVIHKPRQGESAAPVNGTLWASTRDGAQKLRGEIQDAAGKTTLAFLSLKADERQALWVSRHGEVARVASAQDPLSPLAPGLLLSPFDLQLPFTHWTDVRYALTERRRRPTHVFEATNAPGLRPAKVGFAIDTVYGVLVQAVCSDERGEKTRTLQVEEFAKAGEQWTLALCSVRDEVTRDADLLRFTETAVDPRLAPETFEPTTLARPAARPAEFKKL